MPPIRFQFWSPFGVPFWGSFWEPILSIFFCLAVGCWKLWFLAFASLAVKHLARATFSSQRWFSHRLFEGRGGEFRSNFFIVSGCKHALSCQAVLLLRGYADVVRGFLLFLGPNLGPPKRHAGRIFIPIYVWIFSLPHVAQEPASLHERQQNQHPHISLFRTFIA